MLKIEADFLHFFEHLDSIEEFLAIEGPLAKRIDNRQTRRFERLGQAFYIKCHQGVGWREIFKNLSQLKAPVLGAENEWQALHRLRTLGVQTMQPVAFGRKGINPGTQRSFLITRDLGANISLEKFCAHWRTAPPSPGLRFHLIRTLAQVAKTLHEHGLNHRDLYLCHFLILTSELDSVAFPTPYLIDLHRMQIRSHTPQRWKVKDLGSLYFSAMEIGLKKRDLLRFISHYSEQPLAASLRDNKHFWHLVQKRAHCLYEKEWQKLPPDID